MWGKGIQIVTFVMIVISQCCSLVEPVALYLGYPVAGYVNQLAPIVHPFTRVYLAATDRASLVTHVIFVTIVTFKGHYQRELAKNNQIFTGASEWEKQFRRPNNSERCDSLIPRVRPSR
jgi:hypothetical protein